MYVNDLYSCLESWLQDRYGARAVLHSRPLDAHARASLGEIPAPPTTAEGQGKFTWLAIIPGATRIPAVVGMRPIPNPNNYRCFEFVEYFSDQRIHRSFWRLDTFDAWQRAIDT